jgi:hypothetical protein
LSIQAGKILEAKPSNLESALPYPMQNETWDHYLSKHRWQTFNYLHRQTQDYTIPSLKKWFIQNSTMCLNDSMTQEHFFSFCLFVCLFNFYFIHVCIQSLGHFSPLPSPPPLRRSLCSLPYLPLPLATREKLFCPYL